MEQWSNVRRPAPSPTPPARTSSRTPRAGSSTWARPGRCASGCRTTSAAPACRPGRPRWWPRPSRSSGSRSATRSRPSCSSTASSSSTGPGSTSASGTTRAIPSWPSPLGRRVAPGHGHAGQAPEGARRYFGPYAHAYAIRETLDLLLRTFPIRTCSENKFGHHERLGRPACCSTSRSAPGPCVGEVEKEEYDRLVADLTTSLRGHPARRQPAGAADEGGGGRAGVRAGRPPAGPAGARPQGHREAGSGHRAARGPRRHRAWSSDDLEAAVQVFYVRKGRVMGRKGFIVDKVEDVTDDQLVGHVLGGPLRRDRRRRVPKEVLVPDMPDDPGGLRRLAVGGPGVEGHHPGAPAGRQTGPAGHGHPERQGGVRPPPPEAGRRTTTPGPGPSTPCRRPSTCPSPRCGSSATTWATSRAPTTWARWW